MAKSEAQKTTQNPITLREFCTRLSTTDGRVELIGGFSADETSKSRIKDTEANFTMRFKAYAGRKIS